MITNVLLAHPWMSPLALALLVAGGPLLGRSLVRRPRLAWWLLGVSLVPVAVTTLAPVGRRVEQFCLVQWSVPTPSRVELMANVVLFVAPALLLAIATRRPALTLLAGAGLSGAIELVQALVPAIGRSCDTTDWTSNTIGVAIGAALGWAALRLTPVGRPPGRRGRGA
ncbi:VanZ family protein [Pengzhenrongella sicca]|uniref:VanZ family protein n=1 Tax=Pengzhenrongella sicca TaxID=2819238 RepID=A0A8A4Z8C2_9MICO|nr:VanZ family protein [Pengzhenrongella sicca]QTE28160.1 VanZ family protein [Pengzhenrongella sicca]